MATITGNTFTVKDKLKGDGWKWVPAVKGWEKSVPAEWSEAQVESDIRSLGGVRNRMGKIAVSFGE